MQLVIYADLIHATPPAPASLKFTLRVENVTPSISSGLKNYPTFSVDEINPPEVQRVVVEHVGRNADISSPAYTSITLRSFSGKCPHPNNEADYDTWRTNVEFMLKDPAGSDLQRVRKIFESLSYIYCTFPLQLI